jgi:ABC-2 type transport system permease protein
MRISKAWLIAAKDFKIFLRKRNVLYSTIYFPLIVAVGLPLLTYFVGTRHSGAAASTYSILLPAFSFLFIIAAVALPTAIASYSIVGEKVEKSLEPLLATPITDGELLLGKSIAAFFPPMIAIYFGSVIFMVLMDLFTHQTLNYLYFPNWSIGIILLLVAPLSAIFSIEANIIISSRATDVRSAQLQGGLMVIPFGVIYVASEVGILTLNTSTLLIISAVVFAAAVALFFISTRTFRREEILTKWA